MIWPCGIVLTLLGLQLDQTLKLVTVQTEQLRISNGLMHSVHTSWLLVIRPRLPFGIIMAVINGVYQDIFAPNISKIIQISDGTLMNSSYDSADGRSELQAVTEAARSVRLMKASSPKRSPWRLSHKTKGHVASAVPSHLMFLQLRLLKAHLGKWDKVRLGLAWCTCNVTEHSPPGTRRRVYEKMLKKHLKTMWRTAKKPFKSIIRSTKTKSKELPRRWARCRAQLASPLPAPAGHGARSSHPERWSGSPWGRGASPQGPYKALKASRAAKISAIRAMSSSSKVSKIGTWFRTSWGPNLALKRVRRRLGKGLKMFKACFGLVLATCSSAWRQGISSREALRRYFSRRLRAAMAERVMMLKYLAADDHENGSLSFTCHFGQPKQDFHTSRHVLVVGVGRSLAESGSCICQWNLVDIWIYHGYRFSKVGALRKGSRRAVQLTEHAILDGIHGHAAGEAPKHRMLSEEAWRRDPNSMLDIGAVAKLHEVQGWWAPGRKLGNCAFEDKSPLVISAWPAHGPYVDRVDPFPTLFHASTSYPGLQHPSLLMRSRWWARIHSLLASDEVETTCIKAF